MKKILLSILLVIYFGVSSGIAMEIHYCMGERSGVDFFHDSSEKCGKCGMKEKKGGCCSDEHQFYKLSDAHKHISNNIDFNQATDLDLPAIFSYDFPVNSHQRSSVIPPFPPGNPVPIYIFHSVFRI